MKAKRFIIAAILLVCIQGGILAQSEFSFTPKVGLNIANISGTGGTDPRYGVNVGFSVEREIFPNLALESGVFYSMQGMRFSSGNLDVNLDYINVPVLAKYYVFNGLNVFAGPQLGFNVKAEAKAKGSLIDVNIDYKDYIKTFDPALVFGLGYQFDMGLSVSASYNWSFLDQMKDDGVVINYINANADKYHNHVLQFNVGWRF